MMSFTYARLRRFWLWFVWRSPIAALWNGLAHSSATPYVRAGLWLFIICYWVIWAYGVIWD